MSKKKWDERCKPAPGSETLVRIQARGTDLLIMKPQTMTQGEFAGWHFWKEETFENDAAGPFYFKKQEDGEYRAAFRAADKHLNAGGVVHGGCLMAFADYALFAIAHDHLGENYAVTISFNCEFIDGVQSGELVEARGEVIRAGGAIVFVRGMVSASGRAVLNFSGTFKRLR